MILKLYNKKFNDEITIEKVNRYSKSGTFITITTKNGLIIRADKAQWKLIIAIEDKGAKT